MWALVKPGGGVLWYDFVYNNPRFFRTHLLSKHYWVENAFGMNASDGHGKASSLSIRFW